MRRMEGENNSQRENDVNSLVERIKSGIAEHGIYVVDEIDFELICSLYLSRSEAEKRMHIDNFAFSYGFKVHVSNSRQVAIFRKSIQNTG